MKIGFLGAGQMATALAQGFVAKQRVRPDQIAAADCAEKARAAFSQRLPQAAVGADNAHVAATCDVLFLAVKPQHLQGLMVEIAPIRPETLVISIAAGVSLAQLASSLQTDRVIRVMPNTPCLIGEGAAGFCCGPGAKDDDAKLTVQLLEAVGQCWELPEKLLDAVTGLSGSGPAFVYLFIEALADGGVQMGLPRPVALSLAAQTVQGAAAMVTQTGDHPAVLRDRVASPAGTTIAGLRALEMHALRGAVMSAVEAATMRSQALRSEGS